MSNIGVFVGREHHGNKLANVAVALAEKGHVVVPVTANNAINIDPPQMNLGANIHVYNYLTEEDVLFIDSVEFDNISSHTSAFWKHYSIRELLLVYFSFKNFLTSGDSPDAMLILHENNFWTKTLSFLCKKYNIPCFSFQEGLLRDRDQERFNKQTFAAEYSTKMFVWGKVSFDKYVEAGVPEEKMVISGAAHLTAVKDDEKRNIVTYFLPLSQHYAGNIIDDLKMISAYCASSGYIFVVRPHPFEKDSVDMPLNIDRSINTEMAIVNTDVALVQHSTTALECLSLKVPIIEVMLSGKFIQPLSDINPKIPSLRAEKDLHKISGVMGANYIDSFTYNWVSSMILPNNTISIIVDEIEKHL